MSTRSEQVHTYDKEKSIVNVDTLIIGGGPAGISAAIMLQRAGISNAVVDKKGFPRKKLCGGLVTNKTRKALERLLVAKSFRDIAPAFCDKSRRVSIYYRTQRLASADISKLLLFVKRESFDCFLVKHYKDMGGNIYENENNYETDLLKREVKLQNGVTIRYENIIAADGALSVTRESLGYPKQDLSFCLETHIPKSMLKNPNTTCIYFGIIDNGYAWVFPSGKELCIGLGGDYDPEIDYKKKFKFFLRKLKINPDKCDIKGAFVPSGNITNQCLDIKNAVLAGDAGGFTDPIYGEGLYFAIISGMAAGKARIAQYKESEKADKSFRELFINNMSPHINTIRQGYRLKRLFFNKMVQRLFRKRISGKSSFVGFYCDHQVSDYKYSYGNLLSMYLDYKKRVLKK